MLNPACNRSQQQRLGALVSEAILRLKPQWPTLFKLLRRLVFLDHSGDCEELTANSAASKKYQM